MLPSANTDMYLKIPQIQNQSFSPRHRASKYKCKSIQKLNYSLLKVSESSSRLSSVGLPIKVLSPFIHWKDKRIKISYNNVYTNMQDDVYLCHKLNRNGGISEIMTSVWQVACRGCFLWFQQGLTLPYASHGRYHPCHLPPPTQSMLQLNLVDNLTRLTGFNWFCPNFILNHLGWTGLHSSQFGWIMST